MAERDDRGFSTRREFVAGMALTFVSTLANSSPVTSAGGHRDIYIVPNFHPASCGWLTTFSRERVYCANSYLNHLDRVRDDPHYEFVLSEINNLIAIMNFQPQRIPELRQRIAEKRVELVNSFFLESTINLSGGEALARLGVLGQRWYQKVFGLTPRYAWCIDTCGVHDQMAQIASGLGLDALIYTRRNPTGKTLYWSVSPDGSKILTLCPGSYTDASIIFSTKVPLTDAQLRELRDFFDSKELVTPGDLPVMVLAGSEDYSLAPAVKEYPSELLQQWSKAEPDRTIRFATLSRYVDAIRPAVASGGDSLPVFQGGTAYDFDAFWIENAHVKNQYRRNEHALQAAEGLCAIASLTTQYEYPAQQLYDAWIMMCLNMDRNTLWGSAGGMVFVSDRSWDVQDRFAWVKKTTDAAVASAGTHLAGGGDEVALFNPLNWERHDPVVLDLPAGRSLQGVPCESLGDGSVLCLPGMSSVSVSSWRLTDGTPTAASRAANTETIESGFYILRMDAATGGIAGLQVKPTGRELLAAPANRIIAERPLKKADDPGDHMPPIPEQATLGSSADGPSAIQVMRGPVATTVVVTGHFYGGGALRRVIRLYHDHPRIDFETELNDIPNYTVVYAEFPLAEDISEVRRGIPFGFSHSAWSVPNPDLHGWNRGIVPAVRWMDYTLSGGGGIALLDRGLSGRELNGRTPAIYLVNAEDKYWGYENSWLSGKGREVLSYALLPHSQPWEHAAVAQAAWEYNQPPVVIAERARRTAQSFLGTSPNLILEAMRREGNHVELRLVECLGASGKAEVKLLLPYSRAVFTDIAGRPLRVANAGDLHSFSVAPQQIVTLHFETASTVKDPEPPMRWDGFVPVEKLPALHAYDPNLIGHPPFGT